MNKSLHKKLFVSVCLLVVLLFGVTKIADNYSEEYTSNSLKNSAITYGVVRAMNATISLIQGTEIAASPAGVGFTFSVGEILDPINDLVERFSFVVMFAMASLALQKILIGIGASIGFNVLLCVAIIWYLINLWFLSNTSLQNMARRVLYVVVFIRFAIIAVIGANFAVDSFFLETLRTNSEQSLIRNQQNMDKIAEGLSEQNTIENGNETSILSVINDAMSSVKQSVVSAKVKVDNLKESAEQSINHIVNLIVVLVLQTLVIPILFICLFYKCLCFLISYNNILSQSSRRPVIRA